MSRIELFCSSLLAVILCAFAGPRTASGQLQDMTLEDLSHTSTSIVVGTAVKKESVWDRDRSRILTKVTIRVQETIKGEGAAETVITVPGGRIGNRIYEVSDMPIFLEGDEMLLFAWEHPSGMNLVTAGAHGKLDVVEDGSTGRRVVVGGAGLLAPSAAGKVGAELRAEDAKVALEEIVMQIRAFVAD